MSTEQTDATMLALMADAERHRESAADAERPLRQGLEIMGRQQYRLMEMGNLHQPEHGDGRQWCQECYDWWPCQTYRLVAGQ